jgi:hypothetical protein
MSFRNKMHKGQEWCAPWLNEQHSTVGSQHASKFRKCLFEILRKLFEMMQTALHDGRILAGIWKWQTPTVSHITFRVSGILADQPRRQIDALNVVEAKLFPGAQPVASAAEELHHPGIYRPSRCA